jgi:dihydrofolate synthase/folylpolyglutamate synthase
VHSALVAHYQIQNIATVLTALKVFAQKYPCAPSAIAQGIQNVTQNTGLQGRYHVLPSQPQTILDVAHNEDGINALLAQIKTLSYKTLHIITGFVQDKNWEKILSLMPPQAQYYFCQAPIPRALNAQVIKEKATQLGLSSLAFTTVKEAYKNVKIIAKPTDLILICGSCFIVGDFYDTKTP